MTHDLNYYYILLDKWKRTGKMEVDEWRIFRQLAREWRAMYKRLDQDIMVKRTDQEVEQVRCSLFESKARPRKPHVTSVSRRGRRLGEALN